MMGSNDQAQEPLFYSFNLDDLVPQDHLLRRIDRFLDLSDLRAHLAPYYSHTGRPSVDPELMIRMLIIGYCLGIRSERPRVNLTRFHGVFAPNSKYRARVTPAKRGKGNKVKTPEKTQDQTPAEHRASMTPDQVRGRLWAQRLKRVFSIDIATCGACGGAVKVTACIEDPAVIKKILAHLDGKTASPAIELLPECRAPPQAGLFEETHRSNIRLP